MLEVPSLIDSRYRIDREVGQGGFGTVYAGFHLTLEVPVAVKVLHLGRDATPERRSELAARFLEEGRVLTRLRHPNIVSALDLGLVAIAGQTHVSPYLVMEWVDGMTLERALQSLGRPLTLSEAWEVFEPLLDAVAHAHAAHVVHRDIKPANIMVLPGSGEFGVPRIIDFGIAKPFAPGDAAGSGATRTQEPLSPFTRAYAAPEQIAHARTGPWTDVHALGLLFVELVTGAQPYGDAEDAGIAAIDPERPLPSRRGVDVGAFEDVLVRALALRPRERFGNAGEMLEAAREAMRGVVLPAPRRVPSVPAPPLRRSEAPQAAAISLVMPSHTERTETNATSASASPGAPSKGSRWKIVTAGLAAGVVAASAWALAGRSGGSQQPIAEAAASDDVIVSAGGMHWRVQKGTWRAEGEALVGSGGQVVSEESFRDGKLEIAFELLSYVGQASAIGVGVHARPARDPSDGSAYGMNFRPTAGIFNIFKGTDGNWQPVDPAFPTYHPSPLIDAKKNRLVVHASGAKYDVELNGKSLARFDDGAFPEGKITLWVESSSQTVRFSGFRFTQ